MAVYCNADCGCAGGQIASMCGFTPSCSRCNPSVYFHHPDREMFRNQLGLFIIETLRRYEEIRSNPSSDGLDKLIEDRVDKFMRILDRKAGF